MNVSANTQVKTRADHSREYSAVAYFFAFFDSSRYIKVSAVSTLPNITAHSSAINAIEKWLIAVELLSGIPRSSSNLKLLMILFAISFVLSAWSDSTLNIFCWVFGIPHYPHVQSPTSMYNSPGMEISILNI